MPPKSHPQRSRRGSVVNLLVLVLPVMLGMVAMGLDWGEVSVAEFAVRAATDEASLIAAGTLSTRPKTEADVTAAKAKATSLTKSVLSVWKLNRLTFTVEKITFGYFDKPTGVKFTTTIPKDRWPNAAEVTVSARVDTPLAALFGVDRVTVRKTSRAGAGVVPKRANDLVIVQDVTGTMSAGDIANSKVANAALVDCIRTKADKETRGAMMRFQTIEATSSALVSYKAAPNQLYNAVSGVSPTTAYGATGLCLGASGGCTTHASGLYGAVDLLNNATQPPKGIGQSIVIITDGAPWANTGMCTTIPSASGTAFQKWIGGTSTTRCGKINAQTTAANCQNAGGRWVGSKCYPADNGAESGGQPGVGQCTKAGATTEARCEGSGGTWVRPGTTTPNPSALTQWVDDVKTAAAAGKWGAIDIYAVYYSEGSSTQYKTDNFAWMKKHMLTGKGAELGVLDAPGGAGLLTALQALCEDYTSPTPGLID